MSKKRIRGSLFEEILDYMEEFETWADEVFGSVLPEGPSWNIDSCCLNALCNVSIAPKEVIVTADLPNIDPETVKVEVPDENLFEITAKMKKKVRFTDLGIHYREGEFSFLRCQGRIPVVIDSEKRKISFKGGILEVRFPRKGRYEINNSV
jgi:HSP20 family molecular chaperone IbpA